VVAGTGGVSAAGTVAGPGAPYGASGSPAAAVRNLRKSFGGVPAVDDVSFAVDEETKRAYRETIIPYWKGKTHRDRLFEAVDPAWKAPRVVYLANPSDPVTWWDMATLYRRPAWMDSPTGFDLPGHLQWWPVVTWTQVVVDLINGFGAASGHGHNYGRNVVAGWAAVAPPAGWAPADSVRLQELLQLG